VDRQPAASKMTCLACWMETTKNKNNQKPKTKNTCRSFFCFLTTSAAIATRCGGGGAYSAGAAREGCCCCLRRLGTRSLPRFSSVSLPAWRMETSHKRPQSKTTQHCPTQQRSCKKGPKTDTPFCKLNPSHLTPHTHLRNTPHPAREEASPTCPTFPAFSSRSKV
jgi:hypothetical protein